MLKLEVNGKDIEIKVWKFPAGEVGVKVVDDLTKVDVYDKLIVSIILNWESNDDLLALAQLVDIVKSYYGVVEYFLLHVPYFPYSRQDRACWAGEANALKTVAKFINSLGFTRVVTKDAHSSVLEAVVDNLINIPQERCSALLPKYDVFIAPDAGASKKIYKHAQVSAFYPTDVIIADKRRDNMGQIIESMLPTCNLNGKRVCVVDDLCDGGATFLELAEVIHAKGFNISVLDLYVTHGLFTKGVDKLLEKYGTIYTHNLMNPSVKDFVTII